MSSRFATRTTRLWAVTLALVLNVGGGPMAWAHLAAGGHCHSTPGSVPEAQAATDCPEHRTGAHERAQPGHALACCDGGSCACAAPPVPLSSSLSAPADPRHDTAIAMLDARHVAPDPLDDPLRPPIR